MRHVTRVLRLASLVLPAFAQAVDLSVVGGGGFAVGEEQNTHGVSAVGATIGVPYSGRHRIQFDYLFNNAHIEDSAKRHFVTGSYVIQGVTGRTRPFFQIGGGVVSQSFALVLGGGATVDLGNSLFIRPQVRVYGHVGPTLTVLPSVAFGWRF